MIVRCPSCKTTYKVADDLIRDTQPAFRCSRCKHTFELESTETSEQSVDRASLPHRSLSKTQQERELSFTFASKRPENGDRRKPSIPSAKHDFEFPARHAEDGSMNVVTSAVDQPKTIPESEPDIGVDGVSGSRENTTGRQSPSQPLPLAREMTDNLLSLDPFRHHPASIAPFLTLFGLLVILFGFATAFYLAHPSVSEGLVRSIPLVGPVLLKNNHLKDGVALRSLRASRQTIQGNREVLVVTGVAQNQNPVVIREVRVGGQLYDLGGKEIEQQIIWIGNAISPRIIRGMTLQDISDLQRLKPLKTFEIPPGDSVPFTIVFVKPTKETKDFSCEVLTAESEA